jgi:glutamate-ammonia-ligase adenylyltransferase
VLGFGKLGSREMTASSDLDLVVIYDFDAEHPESDGPRALHAVQYYSRLTQRLVTALTTSTRRGVLYEVDMRLRPSGKKGPLAVQFSSFRDYHRNEAEVWEHMALSRARIVCGGADLAAALAEDIQKILAMPRDADALARSIREMRSLIAQEKGEDDPRDIKTMRGGLIDIEFIAQYLRLRWGAEISAQSAQHPMDVIQRAASAGKLDGELANILSTAYAFYAGVTQLERVIVGPDLSRLGDMPGARAKIAIGVGVPDFARLEAQRAEYGEAVRRAFLEILGG